MSITIGADKPTLTFNNAEEHRTQIAQYARSIGDVIHTGVVELLYLGAVTLTSSVTSTDVTIATATTSSMAFLTPSNSNAAAQVASTHPEALSGKITIHHPSATTTRIWNLLVTK